MNGRICGTIHANGEIYNFSHLRSEFSKQHKFYSTSDSKANVHLFYDIFGIKKFKEAENKMSGFAVVYNQQNRLELEQMFKRIGHRGPYLSG